MQPRFVQDRDERRLRLYSRVTGPIEKMSFLRKALLFAELSMIAYNDENEAGRAAAEIGLPDIDFFDHDGSQAFRFRNDDDCVITCRGTEPNEWNDIRADVKAATVLAETAGKVHRGFKREVDDLWPMLETALESNRMPLYFCGHSLGGAMATICAGRCLLSHIHSNPRQLYTYGSPRVGDKCYINYVKLDYYRFVNNNDIVTRVPPVWMGYHHSGQEVYFNRNGEIKEYGHVLRRRDRWRGFLKNLGNWKLDHFADHSVQAYCQYLAKAVHAEEIAIADGERARRAAELAAAMPKPPRRAAA
ncbi:MAG: lipase family protein [Planctomycetaceae bacterium]